MAKATWNGTTIATGTDTANVEGNTYFARSCLVEGMFRPSATRTVCSWKGTAHYYDVVVGEAVNRDAAWYYPEPKAAAREVADRIAFWKGVVVTP